MHWLGEQWDRLWRSLSKRVHFSERGAKASAGRCSRLSPPSYCGSRAPAGQLGAGAFAQAPRRAAVHPGSIRKHDRTARESANRGETGSGPSVVCRDRRIARSARSVSAERSSTVGDLRPNCVPMTIPSRVIRCRRGPSCKLRMPNASSMPRNGRARTRRFQPQRVELGLVALRTSAWAAMAP